MPLESLSQPFNPDEPGRKLREVQVEHEEEPKSAAKEKFDELKNSIYYNKEDGSWIEDDLGDQSAQDQLVGVMALAEFQPIMAKKKLESLYTSKFYQDEWVILRTEAVSMLPDSEAQLYAIAATALFDTAKAATAYEQFLQSCDENMLPGLLEDFIDGVVIYTDRDLLHVLIQTYVNPQAARERYNELASSVLWIPETEMWDSRPSETTPLNKRESMVCDLLLSYLIELRLGLPGVKEKYEKAQRSDVYDAEKQMWYVGRRGNGIWKRHQTKDALLSVIIESRLEKKEQRPQNTPPQIPEERNF